eukprot:3656316-Prymnesium_polylepis.1
MEPAQGGNPKLEAIERKKQAAAVARGRAAAREQGSGIFRRARLSASPAAPSPTSPDRPWATHG